jgi:flagellar basal-body rod protein FlgB
LLGDECLFKDLVTQMNTIDNYLSPHATAISLRQKRMEVIGSNIANAATPGYKARDIDFATAYNQAMQGSGTLETSNAQHMSSTAPAGGPEMRFRNPINPSLDGNTVELHVEQMQFAENATRYEASLQFLADRIRGLRSALRGE